MTIDDEHSAGQIHNLEDVSLKLVPGGTSKHFLRLLSAINAAMLTTVLVWLYCDQNATGQLSAFLNRLHWWTFSWGTEVPPLVDRFSLFASQGAKLITGFFAGFSLILGVGSIWYSKGRERILLPILCLSFAVGWYLVERNWDYIRLRGGTTNLTQFSGYVSEFAMKLDNSWPDQGGDYANFGSYLAYPYGKPRTLIMLGDARIPETQLQVAAVERTPGEAIRFQLVGESSDVWYEWRMVDSPPSTFQGGLHQTVTPIEYYEIASNTFVVNYEITGPEGAQK